MLQDEIFVEAKYKMGAGRIGQAGTVVGLMGTGSILVPRRTGANERPSRTPIPLALARTLGPLFPCR